MLDCPDLAVPKEVMQHVVYVESSRNPFAIGVVGGFLARQPTNLDEALAAIRQLKVEGYNFSVGISQVNRYNLAKYGISTYAEAFEICPNLRAGSRILRECYDRAQDWGKAFSCYYSGNFSTGFEHGYVQKIFASIRKAQFNLMEKKETVRIVPYSNKPGRQARQDDLPLVAPATPIAVTAAPAESYPEPYAIRKFLPSTPLLVTAAAYENAESAQTGEGTTENRPAMPVPGPGAVMPEVTRSSFHALSDIPTQVIGLNGDPYKSRMLPPSPSTTVGLPAIKLPLPNPNALEAQPTGSARKSQESRAVNALVAHKGGRLVHSTESSDRSENNSTVEEAGGGNSSRGETITPSDNSFVF